MRAAAIQLNSTADVDRNLETAERLVAAAAADGAELRRAAREVEPAGRWRGDGRAAPSRSTARRSLPPARWARELGVHLLAGSVAERVPGRELMSNTSAADRPRRRDRRDLPQDPHVRRRRRRRLLPRVRARARRRGDRRRADVAGDLRLGLTVCYDLRFPELFRILALARRRRDHGALRLHRRDRPRPLGGAAARPRDREPALRASPPTRSARRRPHYELLGPFDGRRPVGDGARRRRRGRGTRDRRARRRRASSESARGSRRWPTAAPTPTVGPSRVEGGSSMAEANEGAAGRQAPRDPRRRRPRLRPPGLPRDPGRRHRRRGRRRLRARLPLLPLQGGGDDRALHRALVAAAAGERRARTRSDIPPREKLYGIAGSSSTPTATTRS